MPSDLVLKPDFQFISVNEWNTLVSQFDNGTEQRRDLWATPRKKWRLRFINRLLADFQTIETLFNSKKGSYGSLTWDNPQDGSTYTVRFEEDKLEAVEKAYQIYDFEFNLMQVK